MNMLCCAAFRFSYLDLWIAALDYDFTRDIYGDVCAEFSMGHEALGYWVTHELGTRQSSIQDIFSAIAQLQSHQRFEYELEGAEYNLLLSRENATVRAHALDSEYGEDEPEEDMDLYDQESSSSCGLDDFAEMLNGWLRFISDKKGR